MEKEQQAQRMGQRITALRKLEGISQQELADRAGLTRQHIGRIEKGELVSVAYVTIQQIAEALGMTVDITDPGLQDLAPLKRLTPKPIPTLEEEFVEEYTDEEEHKVPILEYSKNILENILNECNWDRSKAAAIMGISERVLYRRMKQLGITQNQG